MIIAIGASVGVWRTFIYQSDIDKGLIALQTAFREQRPLEARISGFKYATSIRQRGAKDNIDYLSRDRAASLLLGAATEQPGAESHHALGKYYLADRQFDKAIDQCKKALALAPRNAQVNSDLGVVLLEKGKLHISDLDQGNSIEEFARSLEYFKRALELEPTLLEALFNRALLYQYMALPHQAEDGWRRYLEKDPDSKWADEAKHNLKLLEEQRKRTSQTKEEIVQDFLAAYESGNNGVAWTLVSSYHNRTGNVVVEKLLDDYLDLLANGKNDDASSKLLMLSYIGELANHRTGDRYFSDLARFYKSAAPSRQATLVQARRLMKSGHDGWGQSKVEDSLDLFTQAKKLFDESGDVCEAEVAGYWIGFCYFRQYRQAESLTVYERLDRICENRGYEWLRVRALYAISFAYSDSNEHSKAIDYSKRSLQLAEEISDTTGSLNALSALIEYHRYLGNYQLALIYIQRSLPLINSIFLDPLQGCRHNGFEASTFASLGLYAAAAEYQKEALRFALSAGNPTAISVNYAFLGVIYGKLQNYREALKNIQHALEIAEARSGEPAGQEMIAYSYLLMGHLYKQVGDLTQAISNYNRSLELYGNLNLPSFLYQAHKGRLLCYVAQKDDLLVKQEIATTLDLIEKHRIKIFEEDYRNKFFDAEQSVYDQAIDFEYSRMNDPRKAFDYSESSRGRSLLDSMNSDTQVTAVGQDPDVIFRSVSQPLTLAEIQERLPEQSQVLQYSVLEDKVLIWCISRSTLKTAVHKISQDELSEKVLAYLRIVSSTAEHDQADVLRRGKELYGVLVEPVASSLDKNKPISIIPDKVLNYLPYGALVSRSNKYLVEDYRLIFSPSSTVLVASSEIAEKKGAKGRERLLSVGNPRFNRAHYPQLPDLPSAAREARESSIYYDSATTLIGEKATVEEVMKEVENSDVIHLALHSVLDERFPMRSKLLFAENSAGASRPSSKGVLSASEIYRLKLPRTRLAILSACQTGAERYYRGEGMINTARPFLAASVPLVMASLWPVDSDSTAELMISFHRYRKHANLSTAEALRRAQLEMLHGTEGRFRQPYYWAAFILIGGHAEY